MKTTPDLLTNLVPIQEYLGDVELVDVPGVGDDDGRLGVAAPPGVVVDNVVLDGDVIPFVDADSAVWTVVHNVVVDEGVVAGPDGDSPSVQSFLPAR